MRTVGFALSTLVKESGIVGEDGRRKGGEGQDIPRGLQNKEVLFSPVPLESHIKPLLYRDDGTGVKGKPTGPGI